MEKVWMDKYEFINKVIGEGSEESWKAVFQDETEYNNLMSREDESISSAIAEKLSAMSDEELFKYSLKYFEDVSISEFEDLKICQDCNTAIDWNSSHHINGHIWECDCCNKNVCSKCIEDENGQPIKEEDDIICPECKQKNYNALNLKNHTFSNIKIGEVFVVNTFTSIDSNDVDFQLEVCSKEIPSDTAPYISVWVANKDIDNALVFLCTREYGEVLYEFTDEEKKLARAYVKSHVSERGWGNY